MLLSLISSSLADNDLYKLKTKNKQIELLHYIIYKIQINEIFNAYRLK